MFGVEADASSSWVDGSTSCFGHSVDWATSLRGRLGVAFNDNRTLLYGTGGVAWANIDYSAPGFGGLFPALVGLDPALLVPIGGNLSGGHGG